ncbi:helix-turn-helix transcriptional regulator [Arthrobacter pigmenti]
MQFESDELQTMANSLPVVDSIEELAGILRPIMKAVTAAVGNHCEVVLHDLRRRDMDRTIYEIANGHVTGRAVGGPSTNLGLEVLHSEWEDHNRFGYAGRTADGRDLNCSSIYFRDSKGSVMAALCINVDLTAFQSMRNNIDSMMPDQIDVTGNEEVIAGDIYSVFDEMLEKAIQNVGRPTSLMEKAHRVAVLKHLEDHGAFFVKHSMERAAKRLSISKVTAYAYLDEIRKS